MKFSKSIIFLFSAVASHAHAAEEDHHDHDHGHGHKHKCACEAKEFGFKLDCSDKAYLVDAMNYLESSNCNVGDNCAEGADNDCFLNWLIVQTHHDGCLEELVPQVRIILVTCLAFCQDRNSFHNVLYDYRRSKMASMTLRIFVNIVPLPKLMTTSCPTALMSIANLELVTKPILTCLRTTVSRLVVKRSARMTTSL